MDPLLFYIGVLGNIISLLVFTAPIKTFWRITKAKSTEHFEATPYIITLLSSSLWVYYGLTKPDSYLIVTINGAGIVFQIIYVTLFLVYAKPNQWVNIGVFVGINVAIFGGVFMITRFCMDGNTRISVIGSFCACLNICMYASPLTAMRNVINTRSVEFMPFLLSFFLFLNGCIWTVYAILAKDIFLFIPNGIGLFLGSIQLVIYMCYMNTSESKDTNESKDNNARENLL